MVVGVQEDGSNMWPKWLRPLLETRFFAPCEFHADSNRNECNMYCLDCMEGALCSLCLAYHRDHRVIQIRRSSYHDVVRVSEIQQVLDIAGIQTYVINSAKVVFLNERPQPRPGKGIINTCEVCKRGLLTSFRFCSLGCKVAGTSNSRRRRNRVQAAASSEFEDSFSSSSHGIEREVESFTSSAIPPTVASLKSAKRRKGIPHRAPTGGLIIEY